MSNTDKTHGYLIFLRANALAIALISANILYLIVYLNHPALPTKSSPQPNGWWGWFDQGEYYKTTLNLATGELKPSTYWYGYPILGALFYRILPLHPFLIPNLAIFCVILTAFYRASRSFLGEIESGVVSVLIIAATPFLLRDVLVTPWNTIPIHGCFCLMATWIVFEKISLRKLMLSALFVGYGLYCRPSDAFFLALLYGIGVLCLPIWRDRIISIFAIGLSCAFFLSATLLVNLHLFGTWLPPYINLVKAVGFDWTNLGFKIYQLFIDGSVLTGNAALYPSSEISCILKLAPWLLLSLPGLVALSLKIGWRFGAFLFCALAYLTFYLGFNPVGNAAHFWSYVLYHYFWILLPWAGLATYATLRLAPKVLSPRLFVCLAIIPTIGVFFISFETRVRDVVLIDGARTVVRTTESSSPLVGADITQVDSEWAICLTYGTGVRMPGLRIFPAGAANQNYTVAGKELLVDLFADGKKLLPWQDYVISQNSKCINILFMNCAVRETSAKILFIVFKQIPAAKITHVETLSLAWSPGRALKRIFSHIDPATDDPTPSEPILVRRGSHLSEGDCAALLSYGWSVPEKGFTWTDGQKSILQFSIEKGDLPIDVILKGNTFGFQDTTVYIEQKELVEITGDYSTTPFERTLHLAPKDFEAVGTVKLRFENRRAKSPASLGMNTDKRILAIALREVLFKSSKL